MKSFCVIFFLLFPSTLTPNNSLKRHFPLILIFQQSDLNPGIAGCKARMLPQCYACVQFIKWTTNVAAFFVSIEGFKIYFPSDARSFWARNKIRRLFDPCCQLFFFAMFDQGYFFFSPSSFHSGIRESTSIICSSSSSGAKFVCLGRQRLTSPNYQISEKSKPTLTQLNLT